MDANTHQQIGKSPKPETRNVFVDTSAFLNENFGVKSTAFKSLFSLCRLGKAYLKLTDVTLREIESKVEESLAGANKALQEKTRFTRILKNYDGQYSVLFEPLEETRLCDRLMKMLKADFDGAKVEIIMATDIPAGVVFNRYFDRRPPFGPAKKKEEFPDAFVVASLEKWCQDKKQKIYLVSTDGDLQSACSDRGPIIHLKSVAEFVDMVLRVEEDKAEFLAQLFIDNPKPVIEAVTRAFEDRYIYLRDEDGEGEASVTDVDPGAAAVVRVGDNEVDLEFDAKISFTASVSYGANTWDHHRVDLDRSVWVPAEVAIKYDPADYLNYEVTKATVNNGESISIYVDEDAETHWK